MLTPLEVYLRVPFGNEFLNRLRISLVYTSFLSETVIQSITKLLEWDVTFFAYAAAYLLVVQQSGTSCGFNDVCCLGIRMVAKRSVIPTDLV